MRLAKPPLPTEPLSAGVIISALHEAARRMWGDEALARLVASLPPDIAAGTYGPGFQPLRWYPVRHLEVWHEALYAGP